MVKYQKNTIKLTIVRKDLGRDRVVFWGDLILLYYRDYYYGVSNNCGPYSIFINQKNIWNQILVSCIPIGENISTESHIR